MAIEEYIRIFKYIRIMEKLKNKFLNIFLGIVLIGTILLLITFPVAIIPFWEGCIVFLGVIYIISFFGFLVKEGVLFLIDIFKTLFGFRK